MLQVYTTAQSELTPQPSPVLAPQYAKGHDLNMLNYTPEARARVRRAILTVMIKS